MNLIEAFGDRKTLSEWASDPRCIVKSETLAYRIKIGIPAETAITATLFSPDVDLSDKKGFQKGQVFTEQHRQRLSESHKGKRLSEETKKKLGIVRKGHIVTDETRQKISQAFMENEEHRQKSREAIKLAHAKNRGSKASDETREKHRRAMIERYDKIGRQHYEGQKRIYGSAEYRNWRNAVLARDKYTCQYCGKQNCRLEVHHIKRWKEYPELRFDINNAIALCEQCHAKTDDYGRGTHGLA